MTSFFLPLWSLQAILLLLVVPFMLVRFNNFAFYRFQVRLPLEPVCPGMPVRLVPILQSHSKGSTLLRYVLLSMDPWDPHFVSCVVHPAELNLPSLSTLAGSQRATEQLPLKLAHDAPPAHVDPEVYIPPPLVPGSLGWSPGEFCMASCTKS